MIQGEWSGDGLRRETPSSREAETPLSWGWEWGGDQRVGRPGLMTRMSSRERAEVEVLPQRDRTSSDAGCTDGASSPRDVQGSPRGVLPWSEVSHMTQTCPFPYMCHVELIFT